MPDVVTLAETKEFLRVMHDDEDSTIQTLIASAVESVLTVADGMTVAEPVPARIKVAVLARVSVMFDNRESVRAGDGEDRLLSPFRRIEV